jgi:hypothetical protein
MKGDRVQEIRLIDVFLLGPFMIWFGVTAESVPEWAGILMVIFGALTIIYNAKNYLVNSGFDLSKVYNIFFVL